MESTKNVLLHSKLNKNSLNRQGHLEIVWRSFKRHLFAEQVELNYEARADQDRNQSNNANEHKWMVERIQKVYPSTASKYLIAVQKKFAQIQVKKKFKPNEQKEPNKIRKSTKEHTLEKTEITFNVRSRS